MIVFYMLTVPIRKILKKSQIAQNSAKIAGFYFSELTFLEVPHFHSLSE